MKVRRCITSFVFAALSGCVGYLCHGLRSNAPELLKVGEVAPLDAFVSVHSFSEVATVKGVLQALCSRYLLEAQQLRVEEIVHTTRQARGEGKPQRRPNFVESIPVLQRGIQEFKNTEQELLLTQDLLLVLSHEGLDQDWLDLYLNTLYRQPTADLVGRFAQPAVQIGRALGRSDEVFNAFSHLSMIPLEFAAKQQVARAQMSVHLVSASPSPQGAADSELGTLTRTECVP